MSCDAPLEHLTDKRTILAVGLAHAATGGPHDIHPNVWAELKQHFSNAELMELCFVIGHYSGMQLANVLLDTDVNPDEPGSLD